MEDGAGDQRDLVTTAGPALIGPRFVAELLCTIQCTEIQPTQLFLRLHLVAHHIQPLERIVVFMVSANKNALRVVRNEEILCPASPHRHHYHIACEQLLAIVSTVKRRIWRD